VRIQVSFSSRADVTDLNRSPASKGLILRGHMVPERSTALVSDVAGGWRGRKRCRSK
jgi:hypothetical protein